MPAGLFNHERIHGHDHCEELLVACCMLKVFKYLRRRLLGTASVAKRLAKPRKQLKGLYADALARGDPNLQ